jgi:hypothetical protein
MQSVLLLLALALVAVTGTAAAQISVVPLRDLAFGPVLIGVPSYVPPTHPVRSGQVRITAPVNTRVRLRLTLPTQLTGPAGATLPIDFSNNDAMLSGTGPNSVPSTWNPKSAKVQTLTSPTTNVWVGGTVSPAGNQAQGAYTATITLTVTVL